MLDSIPEDGMQSLTELLSKMDKIPLSLLPPLHLVLELRFISVEVQLHQY